MKILIKLAKITLIAILIVVCYIVLNEFRSGKIYYPNNNYELSMTV